MKKLICLLFIAHCSLQITNAQQPTEEWVARYSGPNNDIEGPFLQVDKHGNSYITGTHQINDSVYLLCVKYNTSGVQQWEKMYIYPGEAYIRPTGIALDSSGNLYVAAEQGPNLATHGLIAKFNSITGNMEWLRRYSWGFFNDIKVDKNNNIYVAGRSDTSHLLIRYNTSGDTVWVRKYHPPAPNPYIRSEIAEVCTIDDSLNIILTGIRRFSNPPYGSVDSVLTAKYSSSGILRWESTYFYSIIANAGEKIVTDENGNIYVGGVTVVSGFGVYLTLKYDRNGVQQWAKIYDAPGSGDNTLRAFEIDRINNALLVTGGAVTNGVQMATTIKYNTLTGDSIWVRKDTANYRKAGASDIKVDSLSNVYITGSSNNIPPGGDVDIFSMKYSSIGTKQWCIIYNGTFNGWDGGKSIALDYQNNVLVLGTSQSSSQITDYVVIKYNQLSGIEQINHETPLVYILKQNYPNPFNPSTTFRFSIPKRSFVQLKIYDILGRTIDILINKELSISDYKLSFVATIYPSGVYFYQLIADGLIIDTKKLVLIK